MNAVQIHLMLNHVPVIAPVLALLLVGAGLVTRSQPVIRAGLVTMVLAALVAIPVFFTGEPVEELAERIPGIDRQRIETHEDAAKASLALLGVLGMGALVILATYRRRGLPAGVAVALVALGLVTAVQVASTAHQGGQIRHTELTGGGFAAGGPEGAGEAAGEQDDDD